MDISLLDPFLWIKIYVVLFVVRAIAKRYIQLNEHKKLLVKGAEFKQKRDEKYRKFMQDNADLVPSENIQQEILNCKSLRQLQDKLETKAFTSVQLLMHYINRCQSYGVKLNLISQINFEKALELAKKCDMIRQNDVEMAEIRKNSIDNGLLFGIPVSFKDHIYLKGTHSTIGCINMLKYLHQETGVFEQIVVDNGGIPFVKTNLPQLGLSLESNNRLFGKAMNPINHDRVPGGSSGGCAGLVTTQSSPISFGTDVGGSVRSPSSF